MAQPACVLVQSIAKQEPKIAFFARPPLQSSSWFTRSWAADSSMNNIFKYWQMRQR